MKKHVVIIEDESEIASAVASQLGTKGFSSQIYASAEKFFSDEAKPMKAIYVVDWNLPGMNGLQLIKSLRSGDKFSPIFMVTANSGSEEMIEGLKAGADDYITKPFVFENLLVRIENAWTRLSDLSKDLMNQGIKLLPEAHSVMKDGETVSLTSREYVILSYLYQKAETVTRDELIKQFDAAEKMTVRNIDVHVFSLRKKIKKINMSIVTVWGAGYKLSTGVDDETP